MESLDPTQFWPSTFSYWAFLFVEPLDPTRPWLSSSSKLSFGGVFLIRYSLVLLRSGESLDPTLLWPSALSHSVEPLLSRHVLGFWRCQNFLSVESFDPIHFSLASFGGSLDPTLLWPSALSDSFLWNLSSRQIYSFGPLDHKALTFDVVLVVISFG